MAEHHVCPPWLGYFLLNPLRRLLENPGRLLNPFVGPGMTVLEPGCGMGFFTLPLAEMVGAGGRVIAIDIQDRMLAVLARRARKAGLASRIDTRRSEAGDMPIDDLRAAVDFVAALHVVHEMPDAAGFFAQLANAMKPGGLVLMVEPKGHVSVAEFSETLAVAEETGFFPDPRSAGVKSRKRLLRFEGLRQKG